MKVYVNKSNMDIPLEKALTVHPNQEHVKQELTPDQKLKISSFLTQQGVHVDMTKISAQKVADDMYEEIKKDIRSKNLKSRLDLKKLFREWFSIKSPKDMILSKLDTPLTKGIGVSQSSTMTGLKHLFLAIRYLAPLVAYYIILSVLFRVLAWITGQRRMMI